MLFKSSVNALSTVYTAFHGVLSSQSVGVILLKPWHQSMHLSQRTLGCGRLTWCHFIRQIIFPVLSGRWSILFVEENAWGYGCSLSALDIVQAGSGLLIVLGLFCWGLQEPLVKTFKRWRSCRSFASLYAWIVSLWWWFDTHPHHYTQITWK